VKSSKLVLLLFMPLLATFPYTFAHATDVPAHAAVPYPTTETPRAIDRGLLKDLSSESISVTLALRLPELAQAEELLKALHTPGNSQYHQFLSSSQFAARFAPKDADVAKVIAALAKYGLAAERTTATTLKVTGTPAAMERAFAISLHSYEVPAHGSAPSYTFHASLSSPTIPAEISALVSVVAGLDNRPSLRPHIATAPKALVRPPLTPAITPPDQPGFWTVTDFADYYDVLPLYNRGVFGKGRTIGIVTFAALTPSDAFTYWSSLGLTVDPNRLHIVNIDGGPGAPSDASGSVETTLDVQQSGGIAPAANIIVYQGANTNQAFIDAFAAAAEADKAQTLSVSWGDWEGCTGLENSPFNCPTTAPDPPFVQALHEVLVRAAIQGQTSFTSAADDGAYTVYGDCGLPTCSVALSVDNPADDTAITAAGGTTLAGLQELCLNPACTPPFYDINIPHERVWGWDYLIGFCAEIGYNPVSCGIFPGGGGGGVSVLFEEPYYQSFLPGTQRSQPGQDLYYNGQLIFDFPAHFPGRNVPDVSFNADPQTGYIIPYTSDVSGFSVLSFVGGTSFVAPQLNGVSALLGQYLDSRLGLLNFPLYALAQSGEAYEGPNAPLHAIKYGDNWFYYGSDSYNLGAGLGTMDVANFAKYLKSLF
jgi:kumamolisin